MIEMVESLFDEKVYCTGSQTLAASFDSYRQPVVVAHHIVSLNCRVLLYL